MKGKDDSMDLSRLRELVSAYGAAPARWPEPERAAAEALLQVSAEARGVQREAAGLDARLDDLEPEAPSAALRRAIAEIPLRNPRSTRRWAFERLLPWPAVLAGAVACALGVVSGALIEPSGSDDGWDDVTTVAFASALDEEQ